MEENRKLRKIGSDDIKRISLDILIDVASFCEKNNIRYYLACGTLLGAVRHKGFIPWDDDVDIMMPRPDFIRFMDLYKSDRFKGYWPSEGRYYYGKVYDPKTIKYEKGYDYKKYQPLGVDIDIFPLDGIVNDEEVIKKLHNKSAKLELLLRLSNQKIFLRKNPLKCINRIIPRIIGSKRLEKMIERNAMTYPYETSEYVIRMRNTPNGFTGALKKEVYDEPVKLEFEGHMFYVPRDYDKWLTAFYGDYMTLPPEEKRRVHYNDTYQIED